MRTYTQDDVLKVINAEVAQSSIAEVARRIGVSQPFLNEIVNEHKVISEKVARAFGFEREREVAVTLRFRKIA